VATTAVAPGNRRLAFYALKCQTPAPHRRCRDTPPQFFRNQSFCVTPSRFLTGKVSGHRPAGRSDAHRYRHAGHIQLMNLDADRTCAVCATCAAWTPDAPCNLRSTDFFLTVARLPATRTARRKSLFNGMTGTFTAGPTPRSGTFGKGDLLKSRLAKNIGKQTPEKR
jgi:hypothetical protein